MVLTIRCVPLVPQYNFMCCSCNLKTGTLIIGILGLISVIVQCLESLTSLYFYEEESEDGVFITQLDAREILVGRISTGMVYTFMQGLLIYGAWKDKPLFMLPYVITQFIILISAVILVLAIAIIFFMLNMIGYGVLVLITGALIIMFFAYLWAGVYTYYRQLEELDTLVPDNLLQNFTYEKTAEEETMINTDEMQKTYTQLEQNIQQYHPQPV